MAWPGDRTRIPSFCPHRGANAYNAAHVLAAARRRSSDSEASAPLLVPPGRSCDDRSITC
jgi:uncharacterized RmlC-like cupin family protein